MLLPLVTSLGLAHAAAPTPEPDWGALTSADGWEEVGDKAIDIGRVHVTRKDIGGMWCLRAEASTKASPEALMSVLWDVAGTPRWSSNDLEVSEVLVPGTDAMVFWQHLDVPGWTLIHDRFWILRADALREPDALGYRWTREDGSRWPGAVAKALVIDSGAMEPPVMWGEWRFERPTDPAGPTRVIWRGCQDIGGAVPLWLQVWAAGRSLPAAVADLVHEAERR